MNRKEMIQTASLATLFSLLYATVICDNYIAGILLSAWVYLGTAMWIFTQVGPSIFYMAEFDRAWRPKYIRLWILNCIHITSIGWALYWSDRHAIAYACLVSLLLSIVTRYRAYRLRKQLVTAL